MWKCMRQKGPIMNPNFRFQVLPQSTLPYQNKYNVMNEKWLLMVDIWLVDLFYRQNFQKYWKWKQKIKMALNRKDKNLSLPCVELNFSNRFFWNPYEGVLNFNPSVSIHLFLRVMFMVSWITALSKKSKFKLIAKFKFH